MSEQTINPNNLPIVRIVENGHDTYNSSASTVITATIYNGNEFISVSNCLVPADLQDYDFVWLEDEGVEAMWSDNEFIIDRSEPPKPFKSSRLVKAIDFIVLYRKAIVWLLAALLFIWMVSEFGLYGATLNAVAWAAFWFTYIVLKLTIDK